MGQKTTTLGIREADEPEAKEAKEAHAETGSAPSSPDEPDSASDNEGEDQRQSDEFGGDDQGKEQMQLGFTGSAEESDEPEKRKSMSFQRVDKVWDNEIHGYRLQKTVQGPVFDEDKGGDLFHVRRTFDYEGRHEQTDVDIKSGTLREAVREVMGEARAGGVPVEGKPQLDPNLLFLYLEDLRAHMEALEHAEPTADTEEARDKERKRNQQKRKELEVLVKYLDADYDETKTRLSRLLANGLITFDLVWALWKPDTLAYTTTYGSHDDPRVVKIELAEKHHDPTSKDHFYYVMGKYFDYDGKRFGYGTLADDIVEFRGTRRITSLPMYPLEYRKDAAKLRKELIERGKKFVALSGVKHMSYNGIAYYKKKQTTARVNVKGRIMIDPVAHRRTNPNYPLPPIGAQDQDDVQAIIPMHRVDEVRDPSERHLNDKDKKSSELDLLPETVQGDGAYDAETGLPEFSDELYLLASPVVLGFSFSEKLWLELGVSRAKEIQWSEDAYDSLVLAPKKKDIVKALVGSYKNHALESVDDVIQGKGKGLVAVLHGPPGTGKTLTVESISELLKCPLYIVSAGELGTDARVLEVELQKIMDICHTWGAILLLDEADVFLEKRNMQDLHRNALVSVFLRQLEYFQGILFLTTNRVEMFDDAFQSRIHMALRYESLDQSAKKAVFKIFIERVRVLDKIDRMPFTEEDYDTLARHELNGRQIKNAVRTAQALAANNGELLSMAHIRQVLDVQMSFDRDLKGGPGFQDAMRSYF